MTDREGAKPEAGKQDAGHAAMSGRARRPAPAQCGRLAKRDLQHFRKLAYELDVHRAILFRLRELPGQGFAQSIAAYWVDRVGGRHGDAARR